MFKRILASLLIVFGAILMVTAPAQANGSNNGHKVWVCKYVGQPGDYETLKAGKQPIQVDVSAADDYVGADFADGQHHSVVIDLVTPENTDRHNDYIGEATCPTPPTPSTTSTVPETTSTTTTVPDESTTSTTSPPTTSTTQPPSTTTSSLPEPTSTTSTPATSTVPPTTTTTSAVVPTSTTQPAASTTIAPPPPVKPGPSTPPPAVLAFTGSDSGNWLALGICLFFLGITLLACSKVRRNTHPWDA